jgi:peroxiredoxin
MTHRLLAVSWILLWLATTVTSVQAGVLKVGDLAPDFSLPVHGAQPSENVNLYDYEGNVVLLDFFAHWCPHCQVAAAELHPEIAEYYEQAGGNPSGVPVQLIPISVDNRNPTAVSEFAQAYGLELVLEDSQGQAFSLHGDGFIPHLTVINGAAGANYEPWEILFTDSGYGRGQFRQLRSIIDSVVVSPSLEFDFDADGDVDATDIDLLIGQIIVGSDPEMFDVNGDRAVDQGDLLALVKDPDKLNTYLGDANLDLEFNSGDMVQVFTAGKYETREAAGWAHGDWNADGLFNSSDMVTAFANGGYEQGPRADVAAVPEPGGWLLLILSIGAFLAARCKQSPRHAICLRSGR